MTLALLVTSWAAIGFAGDIFGQHLADRGGVTSWADAGFAGDIFRQRLAERGGVTSTDLEIWCSRRPRTWTFHK